MTLTHLISIGGNLREARVAQGRSLEELSAAINVNRKFLEQIEKGEIPNLPEPYVRAIIRLYASRVGVSLEHIPEPPPATVEVEVTPSSEPRTPSPPAGTPSTVSGSPGTPSTVPASPSPGRANGASASAPASGVRTSASSSASGTAVPGSGITRPARMQAEELPPEGLRGYQRNIIAVFVLLTVISLGISIYWMSREGNEKPVQELPFTDAVKDQEAKYAAHTRRTDSASIAGDAAVQLARGDSLMLEGHSVDSLSLTIAIDHALPREFSLPAQSRIQWRAEKSFTLSIGNPAALELTLNGIRLTSISKSNKPVKNLMLSRSTIEKLQTRPD